MSKINSIAVSAVQDDTTFANDPHMQRFFELFFSRQTITHTLQCMLVNVGTTLDDVCKLATVLHNNDIVFALCNSGIMPLMHNFAYIIPFEYMSKTQLQFILSSCSRARGVDLALQAAYDDGFLYASKLQLQPMCVDDTVILFGVGNLINQALAVERVIKEEYINSCLYTIIHACNMRQKAVRTASQWFDEEGGITW